MASFVPAGFAVPGGLTAPAFRLVPLGPEHNVADHAAWSASIEHIRATPGFQGRGWPPLEGMTLEENLGDLERHARDFAARTGFTYSVLAPAADDVLGCVYIYPARDEGHDAAGGLVGARERRRARPGAARGREPLAGGRVAVHRGQVRGSGCVVKAPTRIELV